MGRKDSLSASKALANNNIPGPNSTVADLVAKFPNLGLSLSDMVALSGSHTMGKARGSSFSARLQGTGFSNGGDINLDFLQSLRQPFSFSGSNTLAQLNLVTPATFDNQYYINLLSGEGLLPSNQVLVTEDDQTRAIVEAYVEDQFAFFEDFKYAMVRMGSLAAPLTRNNGEIRCNCRIVN
ncbi:hypothetical protein LWI29_018079 [Acer saccharum]|uniref:peroxidase n=1 Tax=Acer saccharum TaxID=4024 RepID=A0AA39W928_ACESA|nr:hypothetical protein LWI29_018079 [Acer saccharum]